MSHHLIWIVRNQSPDDTLQLASQSTRNEIPMLTEIVTLHPATMPEQYKHTLSLQQILTTALQEAEIKLNTLDKIALLQALERKLIHKLEQIR